LASSRQYGNVPLREFASKEEEEEEEEEEIFLLTYLFTY